MAVTWTTQQKAVIESRNRNLLVSAAAGSGKTAVLVEHIIRQLTDKEHPVDIDRMLIVTFTKAAASEMKERISQAIEAMLEEEPENEQLIRQSNLIHHAHISTIHGFCSYVIRNYFHMIDLDPGYRIADEGEEKLLETDVVKQVLEDAYAEKSEEFLEFVEAYAYGKTDKALEEMILSVYHYASSAPWPKRWLESCCVAYDVDSLEEKKEDTASWLSLFWRETRRTLQDARELYQRNLELCQEEGGPYMYLPIVEEEGYILDQLCSIEDYTKLQEALSGMRFGRLSSKKDSSVDVEIRELVKKNHTAFKESLTDLYEKYFSFPEEEALKYLHGCGKMVKVLVKLTLQFLERFSEEKRQKNILDYSDLEHFALEILEEVTSKGEIIKKPAALELSEMFEEIIVDEYQDSNLVQEYLLNAVSKISEGRYNIFMVGDVKQSIYRFRLARPELFMEKMHSYREEQNKENCLRIDLHKNFRSRREVVDMVNLVFEKIMGDSIGSVQYDEDAKLNYGADFPDSKNGFATPEVLCISLDEEETLEEKSQEVYRELEASAIANKIVQMVGVEEVYDAKKGEHRKLRYRDCVILLRSMEGWADIFARVLNGRGIPAYATSKKGYFSAIEVVTVLNYLHICDNPMQEIPFTAVLLSPIAGLTSEEVAAIKIRDKKLPIYENCQRFMMEEAKENPIVKKLTQFVEGYQRIRKKASYTPIHELINLLLLETGYGAYAQAMPFGDQRSANLRMLIERAMEFEKTSYRGLFHFIRYIEQLQNYEVDFGEVNMVGENEDTVRIMSIHKSKGLEFPVVFVGGMGRRMSNQDIRGNLIFHTDYGVGMQYMDAAKRIKLPSLMKTILSDLIKQENAGEELRILYVALTRAKEKLILTGTLAKVEDKYKRYRNEALESGVMLPHRVRAGASCYWDWVLPALEKEVHKEKFKIVFLKPSDILIETMETAAASQKRQQELLEWDDSKVYDEKMKERIEKYFSYTYPYKEQGRIPAKVSVSELKRQQPKEEESVLVYAEAQTSELEEVVPFIPRFMSQEEEAKNAVFRGTAYHRVIQCLDYDKLQDGMSMTDFLEELLLKGKITEEMKQLVNSKDLERFLKTNLGQRIAAADQRKELYREQPFVLGVPANQVNKEWKSEEPVLVQGIMDAYFYEKGKIVVVDYKTDRIRKGQEQKLVMRYQLQLEYYAKALEELTGKTVKEKIIYSFALGEEIIV